MTDIDPSYWEPPDDDEAEGRFFEAFADVAREASPGPFYEDCAKRGGVCDCAGRPCADETPPDFVDGRCPRCHGTPGQGHSAACAAPCATCDGTGVQKDDRNCDCHVPILEGAGQHSPGCACLKPCPCGAAAETGERQ